MFAAQARASRAFEEHSRQAVASPGCQNGNKTLRGGEVGDLIHSRWLRRQRRDFKADVVHANNEAQQATPTAHGSFECETKPAHQAAWAWEGVHGRVSECHALRSARRMQHTRSNAHVRIGKKSWDDHDSCSGTCARSSNASWREEERDLGGNWAGEEDGVNMQFSLGTAPLTEVCACVCVCVYVCSACVCVCL
jgi:hypothetical protein